MMKVALIILIVWLFLKTYRVRIEYLKGNKLVLFYTNSNGIRKEIIITQL